MPSFIVHGLIPPLLLLAFRLVPPRVALWTLPLTWMPDLDFWLGVHRATTSNLFILIPGLVAWYRWRSTRPGWSPYAAAGTYYLASHLLMDVFAGGIVPLWPFVDVTFLIDCRVVVETATGDLIPICNPETHGGAPQVAEFFTWISPFEVAMVSVTAAVALAVFAYRWYSGRQPGDW